MDQMIKVDLNVLKILVSLWYAFLFMHLFSFDVVTGWCIVTQQLRKFKNLITTSIIITFTIMKNIKRINSILLNTE